LQFNLDSTQLVIHHPGQLWDTGITLSDIAGAWHHIGVVRSGNTMTSYLGGNLRVSNDGMGINGPDPGEGHLNIGADRTASCEHVYKGLIDDVRIYNRALDPNENEIYPPIDGLPGLIGHWRLDEGGCEVDITAAPCKTAIMTWSSEGLAEKWEQVGDAFFRSITRE
ncbi:MAG: LamG domain-containing protein, partial [Planctomycetes bacterium]|nr:LamG domain-containing protein [Planctomycetota bacterium]